ncbi:uncharacterized protein LOC6734895 isoform X2 [Drosophila simulans]|uniref:Uncharacterized protein, isoform B n=1 Tax=Drosophila simulans TaxID=7240 RepID=A0A0J9RG65_DROSI|nr:uncharacterized protein LOC6734895 isoform X2 [Drosophila simulans]KMY94524.1 uncharacterized protein Dsimw501_GD25484, isoform B [Drosophila simulans]
MALTITKFRNSSAMVVAAQPAVILSPEILDSQDNTKKPFTKLDSGSASVRVNAGGIVLNKIPAIIRPSMKRAATAKITGSTSSGATTTTGGTDPVLKTPKYVVQASPSGSSGHQLQMLARKDTQSLGVAINSLPPNTIIKATTRPAQTASWAPNSAAVTSTLSTPSSSRNSTQSTPTVAADARVSSAVRQAVFIQRELHQPQRSMRNMTLGLVDQAPLLHLGVAPQHLSLLKRHICRNANVTHMDCCLTLRKLKQNEHFALLAEHFELSESDAEDTFKRTLIKLARYLRPLIRWPDARHHNERFKHTPLNYRANLLHVRSLIECVETDVPIDLGLGSGSYKFILCINTNGIISYVSSAFPGSCDDLQLFEASRFRDVIPDYLTLCAEPGKAVRRARRSGFGDPQDSADEDEAAAEPKRSLTKFEAQRLGGQLANQQSLSVVDGALTSKRAPAVQLPTFNAQEPACRAQMRDMIDYLREFRMLDNSAIKQKSLLGYLDEMIVVAAALCNLKRQELQS